MDIIWKIRGKIVGNHAARNRARASTVVMGFVVDTIGGILAMAVMVLLEETIITPVFYHVWDVIFSKCFLEYVNKLL